MPALLVLAIGLAAPGGPPWVRPEASVEVRARARSDAAAPAAMLLELRPSARVLAGTAAVQLEAQYAPRLFVGAVPGTAWPRLQHAGRVGVGWDLTRGVDLALSAAGAYGYEDFAHLEQVRVWSLDPRPLPLDAYAQFQSDLTATLYPHRRLGVSLSAGYALFGSLARAEQDQAPLQRGPFVSGFATWSLTRSASLQTHLWASHALVTDGRIATVARLAEVWRHQWARTLRTELGLGLGAVRRTRLDIEERQALLPVAQAAVEKTFRVGRGEGEVLTELHLQPHLSTFTGQPYERALLLATTELPLPDRARFRARLGASSELGATTVPEQFLLADFEVQYPLRNGSRVGAGGMGTWQQVPQLVTAPTFRWSVYVSFVAVTEDRPLDAR